MIVLDCSAAMQIALKTPEGLALRERALGSRKIIAPRIFVEEITNAVWKYVQAGKLDLENGKKLIDSQIDHIDYLVDTRTMTSEVLAESVRLRHSSYGIFYFVLARRNDATLFTLDRTLAGLCKENGVSCVCGTAA